MPGPVLLVEEDPFTDRFHHCRLKKAPVCGTGGEGKLSKNQNPPDADITGKRTNERRSVGRGGCGGTIALIDGLPE